jgi:CheY-like chemotaxis protein/tetratricopeptide (TPR) repeat protein
MRPDLVISDTDMPGMNGYEFCRQFKSNQEWRDVPFIFLTAHTEIADKIKGLELGVDDYLTKPIYIKEILTRVRILLQKHDRARFEQKKDNNTRFAGQLSDMGVVDLIQTIEVSRKTGVIHFRADEKRQATMFFKDGQVIDAEAGHLQGEDAVYRLLTWSQGEFEALFRPVRRRAVITMPSQSLLMEGMRRLDEWGRLQEQLPPLSEKFQVVYDELWDRLAELPDDINQILRLFDTRRTLQEIIDGADIGDLETVEVISKLYFEGIIVEVDQDKGLKSGSYPVEDLVLQARAASASAGTEADAQFSAPRRSPSQELAAVERELLEPTEQDAAGSMEFEHDAVTKGGDEGPLVGLLEQAITDATLVTDPKGKSKDTEKPKRSTAKGLAVAPLPSARAVDSEDTAPSTARPSAEYVRPKTKPMQKMTPKKDLDAAARMAAEQAGSITSPVANADVQARLADLEAASITQPIEDSVAVARAADKNASVQIDDKAGHSLPGRAHTIPAEEVPSPKRAAKSAISDNAKDGAPDAVSKSAADAGQEYEADLDDLGDDSDLENLENDPPADDIAKAKAAKAAKAKAEKDEEKRAAAAVVAKAKATSTSTSSTSTSTSTSTTKKKPARAYTPQYQADDGSVDVSLADDDEGIGSVTAEIAPAERERLEAAPPVLQSPVVWYALAAAAAGFLVFVAVKSIGDDNSNGGPGPQANLATDGPTGKGAIAPPRTVLPDARAAVALVHSDARVAVAVVPPGPGEETPSKKDQIKALQKEARKARRSGDRLEAIGIIDEALEIKRSSSSLYMKAELLLDIRDPAAAQAVAKELTRAAPKRAQGWRILGQASYEKKDYTEARKAFARYLELSPNAKDAEGVRSLLESI